MNRLERLQNFGLCIITDCTKPTLTAVSDIAGNRGRKGHSASQKKYSWVTGVMSATVEIAASHHSIALTPAWLSLEQHEEEPEVVVAFGRHCRDWPDRAAQAMICCQLFLELGGNNAITKDCHR